MYSTGPSAVSVVADVARDRLQAEFNSCPIGSAQGCVPQSPFTAYSAAAISWGNLSGLRWVLDPANKAETIELLNSYYTLMFDAIGSQGGIVNQMLGDGLMALFGAPLPHADHAERAVRAGLEMLELVAGFDRDQAAQGKPEIRIGVGIASGQVIAGYTGTERRVTYTCVGDTVNLAAHLEAHTKVIGQPILIDEHTRAGLSSGIRVEDHGPVQFKTRAQPVHVYSVTQGSCASAS